MDLPIEVFHIYWGIYKDRGSRREFLQYSQEAEAMDKPKEPKFAGDNLPK